MSPIELQLATLATPAREWAEAVLAEYDVNATGRALVVEGAPSGSSSAEAAARLLGQQT